MVGATWGNIINIGAPVAGLEVTMGNIVSPAQEQHHHQDRPLGHENLSIFSVLSDLYEGLALGLRTVGRRETRQQYPRRCHDLGACVVPCIVERLICSMNNLQRDLYCGAHRRPPGKDLGMVD